MLRFFDESKDAASMLFSPQLTASTPSVEEFKFEFPAAESEKDSLPADEGSQEQKAASVSSTTILGLMKDTNQKAANHAKRKKETRKANKIPYARPRAANVLEPNGQAEVTPPPLSLTNMFLLGQPAKGDVVLIPSFSTAFEPWR